MKITKIKAAGLRGGTPEGGWANEIKPQDCVHTLVAVLTDEGITGWGSVFSTDELVKAALHLLEPLYLGENPQEPERVSEKLHANTFWMGRGGTVTHTISGIDIALWDILGKTTGQPVGRLLGGCYRNRVLPYASVLMREPRALAEHLLAIREKAFGHLRLAGDRSAGKATRWTSRLYEQHAKPLAPKACSWWMREPATLSGPRLSNGRSAPPGCWLTSASIGLRSLCFPIICPITPCCGKVRRYPSPAARF